MSAKRIDPRDEKIRNLNELLISTDNERQRFQRELQSAHDRLSNCERMRMEEIARAKTIHKMRVVMMNGENLEIEYTHKRCRGWWWFAQADGSMIRLNPANIAHMEETR